MKNIGIITKRNSREAVNLVRDLLPWFKERGYNMFLNEEAAHNLEVQGYSPEEIREQADVVIAFGGDGTLLAAARTVQGTGTPILGVNLGGLGFMAEVPVEEVNEAVEKALAGECSIEERVMLNAFVHRAGERIRQRSVLNDLVINKGALARIIHMDVAVDGHHLTTFNADGLIFASPTGSTAYSLSAGGPILYPTLRCLLLTPICPHALSNRPIVLPDNVVITTSISSGDDVYLTMDGQVGFSLKAGDVVEVSKSRHTTRLLIPCERDYFEILRTKLKWGNQ